MATAKSSATVEAVSTGLFVRIVSKMAEQRIATPGSGGALEALDGNLDQLACACYRAATQLVDVHDRAGEDPAPPAPR